MQFSNMIHVVPNYSEIKYLRWFTFGSVALCMVTSMTAIVVIPMLYNYTQYIQSTLEGDVDYCHHRAYILWQQYALIHAHMGIPIRTKRQEWGYPNIQSSGCSQNHNSYCPYQDFEIYQPTTCQPEQGCSYKGAPGPPGLPGKEGRSGRDGKPGKEGANGEDANQFPIQQEFCFDCQPGYIGPPGPVGMKGDSGELGPTGEPGYSPSKGPPGMTGPIGSKGLSGEPGPRGPPGSLGKLIHVDMVPGPPGTPGKLGSPGPLGIPGLPGKSYPGPPGPTGDPGKLGLPGRPGAPGTIGPPGPKGAKGTCDHCPFPRTPPGYGL